MVEKIAQEFSARAARRFRAADARGRQRAAHAVHGVVVEFEIIRARAVPVADVRLVPDLPIPLFDLGRAVSFDAMFRPLIDQLAPFRVILRRIRLSARDRRAVVVDRRVVRIILRMRRQRLRHETDLHIGLDAAFEVGVENLVVDRPVVNRIAVRVLLVGAGGTPFERIRAVAAGEQMVGAEINLRSAELAKFRQAVSSRPSCRRNSPRPRRRTARWASTRRPVWPRPP